MFIVLRFKDRGQAIPEQTHGKPTLEIALTILPALILIGIGIPTVSTLFELAKTDDTECIINVTGQQWWWEYDYPAQDSCGGVAIGEPIVTSGQLVHPDRTRTCCCGSPAATSSTRSGSRSSTASATRCPGACTRCGCRPTSRASTPASAPSSAGSATPTCGWRPSPSTPPTSRRGSTGQTADYTAPQAGDAQPPRARPRSSPTARTATRSTACAPTNADGQPTPVIANPDLYVVSGAAPNLTHLMIAQHLRRRHVGPAHRRVPRPGVERLAGGVRGAYLQGVTPECLNEVDLREWLRNAPAKKPMYASDAAKADRGGKVRGMPNLNLSEDQIDLIVAYLLERK